MLSARLSKFVGPGSFVHEGVTNVGMAGMMLGQVLGRIATGRIDWSETFYQIDKLGIGSVPIVALSASFIGMAISVQFAREIVVRYGADGLVGGFVAVAMFRELAPVFVAIVIAGNIGASMTAEIGTMKVTDQVDAMTVFKVEPLDYLVVPRIVSTAISGPILTVMGAALSLLSGQMFSEAMVGVPSQIFWDSVKYTTTMTDITNMLVKSLVFSVAVALIASINGLATEGSSEAVGQQTTRTVVWSLLSIFILNYIVTSIFFSVG